MSNRTISRSVMPPSSVFDPSVSAMDGSWTVLVYSSSACLAWTSTPSPSRLASVRRPPPLRQRGLHRPLPSMSHTWTPGPRGQDILRSRSKTRKPSTDVNVHLRSSSHPCFPFRSRSRFVLFGSSIPNFVLRCRSIARVRSHRKRRRAPIRIDEVEGHDDTLEWTFGNVRDFFASWKDPSRALSW